MTRRPHARRRNPTPSRFVLRVQETQQGRFYTVEDRGLVAASLAVLSVPAGDPGLGNLVVLQHWLPDGSRVAARGAFDPRTGDLQLTTFSKDFGPYVTSAKRKTYNAVTAALEPVVDRLFEFHNQNLPALEGDATYALPEWP